MSRNKMEFLTYQSQEIIIHGSSFINEDSSVVLSNGMVIVTSISIPSSNNAKTVEDFGNTFTNQIILKPQGFS